MPLKLAVITSVYNESDFLYQFLRHYTDQVDTIFVLDNESTDGSTSMCHNFPNVELSSYATGGKFDDKKKHATVLEKGKACAGSYDYVIYVDSDEFIVSKNGLSIRETIECSGKKDIYGTEGWNIYEYPDDKPYDPTQPVLSQRQRGVPNEWYSKPCIVRPEFKADYCLGFHYLNTGSNVALKDPEKVLFWLFHLRGFCEEIFIRRSLNRSTRMVAPWPGHYYWGATEEDFRKKFAYERTATTVRKVVPDGL